DFTNAEGFGTSATVAVVNATLARDMFDTEDVVGREIFDVSDKNRRLEVVGVVADLRTRGLNAPAGRAAIYLPFRTTWGSLQARVNITARAALPLVRAA